jgi:hypothetical protein
MQQVAGLSVDSEFGAVGFVGNGRGAVFYAPLSGLT